MRNLYQSKRKLSLKHLQPMQVNPLHRDFSCSCLVIVLGIPSFQHRAIIISMITLHSCNSLERCRPSEKKQEGPVRFAFDIDIKSGGTNEASVVLIKKGPVIDNNANIPAQLYLCQVRCGSISCIRQVLHSIASPLPTYSLP